MNSGGKPRGISEAFRGRLSMERNSWRIFQEEERNPGEISEDMQRRYYVGVSEGVHENLHKRVLGEICGEILEGTIALEKFLKESLEDLLKETLV